MTTEKLEELMHRAFELCLSMGITLEDLENWDPEADLEYLESDSIHDFENTALHRWAMALYHQLRTDFLLDGQH